MPRNATTGVYTRVSNSFSQPVEGTIIDNDDAKLLFDDQDDEGFNQLPQALLENSVKNPTYGALGNGVADDTAAIQAFLTNAPDGIMYLPKGTYMIGAAGLTGVSNKIWVGDGMGQTIIKCSTAPTADFIYFTGKSKVGFKGITFDGNSNLTGATGHYPGFLPCILMDGRCNRIIFEECEFIGFDTAGLLTNTSYDIQIRKCIFTRAAAKRTANSSILLVGTGTVDADNLRNFIIDGCTITNANVSISGHDGSITNNNITGWGFSAGINTQALASNHSLYIGGNKCHDSNQQADQPGGYLPAGIENWARNSAIVGNECYGNYGSGIDNGGADCTIIGNDCYDNGAGGAGSGAGISMYANDATFKASGCVVEGNRCTNVSGVTQSYGYFENASLTTFNATGIVVGINNFQGNATAATSLIQTGTMATRVGTMAAQIALDTNSGFTGGLFNAVTSLSLAGSGGNLTLASSGALGGNRTVSFSPGSGNRVLTMGGDVSFAGQWATTGNNAVTIATSGTTTATLPSGTYTFASLSNTLNQFAATTSAQLAAVISDETGSGALVFGTAPTIAGGVVNALTSFSLAGSGGNLIFASAGALGGNQTFSFNPNAGNRAFSMAGDLTLGANLSTAGGAITLNASATTTATLPPGTSTLPAVVAASGTQVSHTGDTSEFTLATITLPANSMGANGTCRITCTVSYTGTAGTHQTKIKFGGTIYYDSTAIAGAGFVTGRIQVDVINKNATNSQAGSQGGGFSANSLALVTSAVDTTSNVSILITTQLGNSADTGVLQGYTVEVIRP